MKISLNWIKEFVEVPGLSAEELAQTITLSVCEVEGYEETGTHLKDVYVAEVLAIEPHPNADKLCLVTVDQGEEKKVVCGAHNFIVGSKVPYVGVGAVLPGDFKIKPATIRGVESCGMLCAEDELGFSGDHEGLMILSQDAEVGSSLEQLFPDQVDIIFEIDNKSITHRPDLWGHYGFARELGTIFQKPVHSIVLDPNKICGEGKKIIDVEVMARDLVPRYSGLSISNVEVKDSSLKMQYRLTRVGLRPLNNLVDLTNYVMLELGQPLHAFDAYQIAGSKLTVKLAEPGTKVMTLYQKVVQLGSDDLTICDANGPSVVAGIIGGLNSGVTDSTTSIFLEAANWNPVMVRKTSTRIGIRTDASQRFEKSLDPELTTLAVQRVVELLEDTCPDLKICGELIDHRGAEIPDVTICTTIDFINKRLGKQIEEKEIRDILIRLGFTIKGEAGELEVVVPSFRRTKDISIPEDLVEEIGRIHGFNNILPAAPLFPIEKPVFNLQRRFETSAKAVLRENNFHEVYNYPLTCKKNEELFGLKQEGVMKLVNPVADHQDQMRTSLLPHFVQSIYNNQKITQDFRVFEIGRIYRKQASGEIQENQKLVCGVSLQSKNKGDAFFLLKSKLINLFSRLQVDHILWQPMEPSDRYIFQHVAISAAIYSGKQKLGTIYSFSPEYRDKLDLKGDVCISELDFDHLYKIEKTEYRYVDPPKYPPVNFEVSVLVPERSYFQEIANRIRKVDQRIVKIDYLGVYRLEDYPEKKSLSISMEFQSSDKTLDSNEVKDIQDRVVQELVDSGMPLR